MTTLRNHYVVGFKGRLGKFLSAFQGVKGLIDVQRMLMVFKVCGWLVLADLGSVQRLATIQLEVEEHRRILGLAAGKDVSQ